jgi:hypothetical protein
VQRLYSLQQMHSLIRPQLIFRSDEVAVPLPELLSSIFDCGFLGFNNTAIDDRLGTISFSNSRRFVPNSGATMLKPVTLPPGRARLSTSPAATGSPTTAMTIGIVRVVALRALAAGVPPVTMKHQRCCVQDQQQARTVHRLGRFPTSIQSQSSFPPHIRVLLVHRGMPLSEVTTIPVRPEGGRQSEVFFVIVAREYATATSSCQ